MPIDYAYRPTENYIYIDCFGELTIHEIFEYFSALKTDASIPNGAAELVDLSKITYFNVDHKEVAQMPESYLPAHAEKEITATILFGSTRINMGLTLLIEAYFRKNMPQHYFVTVDTIEDALKTLKKFKQDQQEERA